MDKERSGQVNEIELEGNMTLHVELIKDNELFPRSLIEDNEQQGMGHNKKVIEWT